MEEIYLDNAATTRPLDCVTDKVCSVMREIYGNPSSKHIKGVEAEAVIKDTKKILAGILKLSGGMQQINKEIIFTSGATEANNLAIFGTAQKRKRAGNHIITTAIEHPSVKEAFLKLEKEGYRVTFLPVDSRGIVSLDALSEVLCDETILVSVMYVNNETGAIQPVDSIGEMIKNYNPDIYFHVDSVQAFGKLNIYPEKIKADMISVSAHKFHGPKGVGFLYARQGTGLVPILYGGGQQYDMRPGTENVPAIAGMGLAAQEAYSPDMQKRLDSLNELRKFFVDEISSIEDTYINSPRGADGAAHIVSASFTGVKSEVLLHALESEGIYVSSGSACSSNHPGLSSGLEAMGLDKSRLDSVIRFSFCSDTTLEEIQRCVEVLKAQVPVLRQFQPV